MCQKIKELKKSKHEAVFSGYIFNQRYPHKSVLLDKVDTNCGIMNSTWAPDSSMSIQLESLYAF